MQLVPLSTDGRVEAVATAPLPPGQLHVALRTAGRTVMVEALGPARPRRVGRLAPADAAAYGPVLARLAARGHVGTCPARVTRTGPTVTLTLQLGSSGTCAPRDTTCPVSLPVAKTIKLLAAVPRRGAAPRRTCPPRSTTAPRTRSVGRDPSVVPSRRPPLPARPPARFGRADDPAPRLTRLQRRRVLWASIGLAALLMLASAVQKHVAPASAEPAASATGTTACGRGDTSVCRSPGS